MKEIRPRLSEEEYDIILTHRKLKKDLNKEVISYLVNNGDGKTCEEFALSKEELATIKENEGFDKRVHPKILLLDIETLPMWIRTFGLYKQRIPHTHIIKDWSMLSWSCKWLYDKDTMCDILTPEEAIAHDDKRILESLWDLLEVANIVIGHNARRFDIRKINARFWINKMKPTTPYQTIDTLKESQVVLGTSSHRLDYLGKLIHNKGKLDTDWELWVKCDEGDQGALDYMKKYNIEDTLLLEEVYLELRPFMRSHPNIGIHSFSEETICPYCASENLTESGYYATPAGRYISLRCDDCGGISRRRHTDLTKQEKKNLIISTAR